MSCLTNVAGKIFGYLSGKIYSEGEGLGDIRRQKIVRLSIFGNSIYYLPVGSLGNERLTNYLPFTVRDGGKEAMSDQNLGRVDRGFSVVEG